MRKAILISITAILAVCMIIIIIVCIWDKTAEKDSNRIKDIIENRGVEYEGEDVILDNVIFSIKKYVYSKECNCGYVMLKIFSDSLNDIDVNNDSGNIKIGEKSYKIRFDGSGGSEYRFIRKEDCIELYYHFMVNRISDESEHYLYVTDSNGYDGKNNYGKFYLGDADLESISFEFDNGSKIIMSPIALTVKGGKLNINDITIDIALKNGTKKRIIKNGKVKNAWYLGYGQGSDYYICFGTIYDLDEIDYLQLNEYKGEK